jgi:C-8 sterol isomerase
MHHLPRGQAEGYRIPERAWALEYARGWVPAMFPFGTVEVICSTWDFHTFWTLVDVYGHSLYKEFLLGKF